MRKNDSEITGHVGGSVILENHEERWYEYFSLIIMFIIWLGYNLFKFFCNVGKIPWRPCPVVNFV